MIADVGCRDPGSGTSVFISTALASETRQFSLVDRAQFRSLTNTSRPRCIKQWSPLLVCVSIASGNRQRGEIMRLVSRSGLIAIVLTVAAIAASTAQASAGLAGIQPVQASTAAQASADQIAAERAAHSPSAPLDRFSLAHVHTLTPSTTTEASGTSDSQGFHVGDAAIGAGLMAGLLLLGAAGTLAARRHRQPVQP
jgi:hypothetical protein